MPTPLASGLVDEVFTYDPVGNRRTSHLSATHVHDAANRLLEDDSFTYTYDANGNRTSKTDKTTLATTTYTYDIEHQLLGVTAPGLTAAYRYDGLGRRIEKDVAGTITRFLYDQEDIVGIFTGPTNCQTHAYLHGPGIDQPLAFLRDTNADCNPFGDAAGFREPIVDVLTDGLGSPVALTSETHGFFRGIFLAERYAYDSFGRPAITGPGPDGQLDTADDITLPESALGNPYLFTGMEYDAETGLYYYRARYYDPRIGRFRGAPRQTGRFPAWDKGDSRHGTNSISTSTQFKPPDHRFGRSGYAIATYSAPSQYLPGFSGSYSHNGVEPGSPATSRSPSSAVVRCSPGANVKGSCKGRKTSTARMTGWRFHCSSKTCTNQFPAQGSIWMGWSLTLVIVNVMAIGSLAL